MKIMRIVLLLIAILVLNVIFADRYLIPTKTIPADQIIYSDESPKTKNEFVLLNSQVYLDEIDNTYDFIYVDGDHRYEAVKRDWELCQDKYNRFILFDDYNPPSEPQSDDIQCYRLIDEIEDDTKELIIMDRRIFFDDRRIADEDIKYGQVLLSREES